jgi:hypothetical protein
MGVSHCLVNSESSNWSARTYVKMMSTSPHPGSLEDGKLDAVALMRPNNRIHLNCTMIGSITGKARRRC